MCSPESLNSIFSLVRFASLRSISGLLRPLFMAGNAPNMKLVWIDMEMTGLKIDKDKVLEVACLLTDTDLREIIEGPHLILHQPESTLASMDPWCVEQHAKSGLVEECKRSQITESKAEKILLDFVMEHIPFKEGILAGNTVHMDKKFLEKYFPKVDDYLHYRILDVSSVKELCRWWFPNEYHKAPQKSFSHRALDDIRQSVEELRYYKKSIFKSNLNGKIM
ncbi:oligoribonuclease [Ischnura elegans]|uniref:oligoribonuclease n=1 Tax=Ischnura elegans TaxID=197161 RepID=UPI001ED88F5E|nr:oligoribonuclease [Ischnura elegans]